MTCTVGWKIVVRNKWGCFEWITSFESRSEIACALRPSRDHFTLPHIFATLTPGGTILCWNCIENCWTNRNENLYTIFIECDAEETWSPFFHLRLLYAIVAIFFALGVLHPWRAATENKSWLLSQWTITQHPSISINGSNLSTSFMLRKNLTTSLDIRVRVDEE